MTALSRHPAPQPSGDLVGPAQFALFKASDVGPSAKLTLADVLAALPNASNVTSRQREEMASAIRTVARLLGEDPAQIPANRRALSQRFRTVAPIAHGISKASWSNVHYRLNKALDLVLPPHLRRQRDLPLAPEWQELKARIADQWTRKSLSRLFHFCSEAGISPEQVGEGTLEQFPGYLDIVRLKGSAGLLRDTRRAWNRACSEVPDWPGRLLETKPRKGLRVLPWETFPASLRADLQGWLDYRAGIGLPPEAEGEREDDGPSKPARPTTLKHREHQVQQFASTLVKQGVDPSSLRRLADLVEPATLRLGAEVYRRDGKYMPSLPGLVAGLQSIARHWVRPKPSADDMQKIRVLLKKICKQVPRRGMTTKNRARLYPILDDPEAALALLRLPGKLLGLAENVQHPHRAALLAQVALTIEILLMVPLRIGNLAALDTERHLVLPRRPGGKARIVIDADEVKNEYHLDYPLPEPTVVLLRRYLREFRPTLAEPGSTALFPGQLGRAKNPQALGRQISRAVFEHTELRMNPHLFRHAMASLYLKARPGDFETVRLVLGHKSLATTAGTYVFTEEQAAMQRFRDVILAMRDGTAL
ncbi:tyrosine-type recombinase/integrase [Siccirubricoccus sp. G192]|uniref:tyrosine-type recombinase/integrase n=1 Tax=Siccirubricoccus sp. G192 TaxID=2849651 RepID=UPI001C2BC4F1|nr:tyrosine-type recombinase/integrase [Siccirubricoccus sp. G192]MBV1800639.1 tyrosine-type recombinase/integrase [Siccirubricoccus sp. G192]MBV1800703.1 tyrosine-type recombinase/integrase [Siccirubricoccus sp. G192]